MQSHNTIAILVSASAENDSLHIHAINPVLPEQPLDIDLVIAVLRRAADELVKRKAVGEARNAS